jgi:hypothetical protein
MVLLLREKKKRFLMKELSQTFNFEKETCSWPQKHIYDLTMAKYVALRSTNSRRAEQTSVCR